MTTPQGTGDPTNLWPDTEMEPMGFLKVTMGARFTNGICAQRGGKQRCARGWAAGKRCMHAEQRPIQHTKPGRQAGSRCAHQTHHHAKQRAVAVDEEAVLAVARLLWQGGRGWAAGDVLSA